jgi:hypothetical protein
VLDGEGWRHDDVDPFKAMAPDTSGAEDSQKYVVLLSAVPKDW